MSPMRNITICRFLPGGALLALLAVNASSQTQIDLRTQAKNVDFSAAAFTKSFQTGSSLPASCTVGGTFFKSDAQAGVNFYGCTSTNTWTQQGASLSSRYILDSADANLPNAQFGVAGPGITISHSPFTISFNSNVLAGVYPSLAGPNNFTAGGRNSFQASVTTEGIRIVGGAIPSAPLGGALFMTLSGQEGHFDGTNVQIHTTVGGSGITAPTAPASGDCAAWAGGFNLTDGGGPCAVRVNAPSSAGASCAVGQYAATSTFFYVCVATNTWVRASLGTW
jgi:hypothetical protein